jgi:3-ketosteroid 9alpha-monooxygenase subunit B
MNMRLGDTGRGTMRAADTAPMLDGRARARFHPVRVQSVVDETADARTFVLAVPPGLESSFAYRAGQFVTVRVEIDDEAHLRAYSMSSTPGIDRDLRITVKRVPGGRVSNWLADNVRASDTLEVTPPAGSFVVPADAGDLVAYAAGSGITPVVSILAAELAEGDRRMSLLYGNRDRASTIFAWQLDQLAERHSSRLRVVHHFDVDAGFVTRAAVAAFVRSAAGTDHHHFVCGPDGFMATVEAALKENGVDSARVHVERFTPAAPIGRGLETGPEATEREITIRLGGRKVTVSHRPGTTVLQSARFAGLGVPSSCETGSCATCMARVLQGEARMRNNEALTQDEVADGWVLTCQAEPVTPSLSVIYE